MKVEWDLSELIRFGDNLSNADIDNTLRRITKDIAKALLKRIKGFTPVQDYDLLNAWGDNKILVTETDSGYQVILVNKMEYATWVNDGHAQRPGRFIPGYWTGVTRFVYDRNASCGMVLKKSWVKGVFFVEKGIASIKSVSEIEQIIMRELRKWWDAC